MHIFSAGVRSETNTFSPLPTGIDDFQVIRASDWGHLESSDWVLGPANRWSHYCKQHQHQYSFGLMAIAEPAGPTVKHAYEALRDEILSDLENALPVDVVLLDLHGAMVADGYEDCEGDLTQRIRSLVGADVVIGMLLDPHCHVSATMMDYSDFLIAYKEYPHIDVMERSDELIELAVAARRREVRPTKALFDCRMMSMYPTNTQPMRGFVDDLHRLEAENGILTSSLVHGFPWGDTESTGTKMLVISDDNPQLAIDTAESLGMRLFDMRDKLRPNSLSLEGALTKAAKSTQFPVVVADQSDNAGGGAPGDSTFALQWILENDVKDVALAMIYDPAVVSIAKAVGYGAEINVRLGGKLGPSSGDPIDIKVTVGKLLEAYQHEFPQGKNESTSVDIGDTVALHGQGVDILVCSARSQCFSPKIYTDFGIDPMSKKILLVKSTTHFAAAFEPIAAEIIYMAAPGAIVPAINEIPYSRMSLDKYPWVENPHDR
jgi:microcystin degradation protein MlrC